MPDIENCGLGREQQTTDSRIGTQLYYARDTKMLHTENRPPEASQEFAQQIVRAPATGELHWVILSKDLIGVRTHYLNRRTQPCDLGFCSECERGLPWRWHAYLSVWNPKTNHRAVLELPAAASSTVGEFADARGTLRGSKLTCWRLGSKTNGRVQVKVIEWQSGGSVIPDAIDIERFLCHLWNVAFEKTARAGERPGQSRLATVNFQGAGHESNGSPGT